jgi:hypothetical protein
MGPPDARERRLAWVAALGAAALSVVAALSASRPSSVVLAIAAAFVPYAGLVCWRLDGDPARAQRIALGLAALAGVALVVAPPVLSDDVHRYLWDARVLRHGIDPYAYAPSDPALAPLRDPLHARVNHADLPTIYPPVAQLIFALADLVAHAPWSPKLAALAAHLLTTPVVARLAGPRAAALAPLHALNPLLLAESAMSGHVDAFAGLFVALAVLAMVRGAWTRASLALALATGVKLVGLALVPLLAVAPARRRTGSIEGARAGRRALPLALALGLGALTLLPVASAGHARDEASGLGHYARRWRGNEGGFFLLAEGSRLALELAGRATGAPPGWVRLPFLAPALERVEGTPLDPRATFVEPKKELQRPTSFETPHLGELLARFLALSLVLTIATWHARRRTDPLRASRDVILATLLLAPQVHPWYLAWLLPIEIASGGLAGLAWSAAVLVAYSPLEGWAETRSWDDSAIARGIEYAVVVVALLVERRTRDTGAIPHATAYSAEVDP